jgi:hypothetical protein
MFESVVVDLDADDSALVERISQLERLKSAAAASQARLTVALDEKRRAAEAASGVPAGRRGKGLGSEVGLARHESPHTGARLLSFARILITYMPHTLAALAAGVLSERRAMAIVGEAAHLNPADRAVLDAQMCAHQTTLTGKGDQRITADAKAIAARLDPQGAVERAARAAAERRVTFRPAPNAMSYLTVTLPIAHGKSVHAALARHADTIVDGRTRGQVMADTVVERLTGQSAQAPVPVAVNLVITDDTLLAGGSTPARIPGAGPIPAGIARRMIAAAVFDDRAHASLRRLYRHPTSGTLVAMESRSRVFPKGLASFIDLRDDACRTPYCDAPIRHHDHAHPNARGGPTNALNGLGECEACNYAKEAPGWQVTTSIDENGTHTAEFSTPTGAVHHSHAPPLPGPPPVIIDRYWRNAA